MRCDVVFDYTVEGVGWLRVFVVKCCFVDFDCCRMGLSGVMVGFGVWVAGRLLD